MIMSTYTPASGICSVPGEFAVPHGLTALNQRTRAGASFANSRQRSLSRFKTSRPSGFCSLYIKLLANQIVFKSGCTSGDSVRDS